MSVLIVAGYFFFTTDDKQPWKIVNVLKKWRIILFVFYLSFLIVSAIFVRQKTNPYPNILSDLFYTKGGVSKNKEVIENTLFFIPYTILFLQAFKPKSPLRSAFLVSVVTSCFIELFQLLFWLGYFQLTDIIHNTLGGLIGYLCWKLLTGIKQLIKRTKQLGF